MSSTSPIVTLSPRDYDAVLFVTEVPQGSRKRMVIPVEAIARAAN